MCRWVYTGWYGGYIPWWVGRVYLGRRDTSLRRGSSSLLREGRYLSAQRLLVSPKERGIPLCAEAPSLSLRKGIPPLRREVHFPKETRSLCAERYLSPKETRSLCAESSPFLRRLGASAQRVLSSLGRLGASAQRVLLSVGD